MKKLIITTILPVHFVTNEISSVHFLMTAKLYIPLCPILNDILNNVTLYSQSSTAVTHCILVDTHFTDPEGMIARVKK